MSPSTHEVKTGEIIEMLTTTAQGHGPSRDWLSIAKTSQARNKIRSWFKKEKRPENIATGKSELEREFSRNGIRLPDAEMADFLNQISERLHYANLEEFYAAIGYGGIRLSKIMPRVKEAYSKLLRESRGAEVPEITPEVKRSKSSEGVMVEGIDNCLIKLSQCCTPLPGDEIIGFITRGHGVSIHKRDCNNVPPIIENAEEPERWVKAYWATGQKESFKSSLQILAIDRSGMLADITVALASMRVMLHSVNARESKGGNCIIDVTVSTENLDHLKNIITRLSKIPDVVTVDRLNQ